jgi:hypothetical protein
MWVRMDIVAGTQALGPRTCAGDIDTRASNTKREHRLWTPTQASTYSLLVRSIQLPVVIGLDQPSMAGSIQQY